MLKEPGLIYVKGGAFGQENNKEQVFCLQNFNTLVLSFRGWQGLVGAGLCFWGLPACWGAPPCIPTSETLLCCQPCTALWWCPKRSWFDLVLGVLLLVSCLPGEMEEGWGGQGDEGGQRRPPPPPFGPMGSDLARICAEHHVAC